MNALTFPVQTIGPLSLSRSDTILDCPCSFSRQDLISDRSDVTFTLKCLWCALLWWYSNQQGLIESGFGNYSCGPVLLMEMSTILMSTAALSLPASPPLTETVCMVWNTIYIDCSMATFNTGHIIPKCKEEKESIDRDAFGWRTTAEQTGERPDTLCHH